MRAIAAVFTFVFCGLCTAPASAQPAAEPLIFGYEETIVPAALLSAEQQAEFRQAWNIELDLNVGFAYRRAFIFKEGFALWTWHGRHVLFDGDNLAEIEPAQLANLIGPEHAAALSTPLAYRLPPGLLTIATLTLLIVAAVYFVPTQAKKLSKLLADSRYLQALDVYAATLPQQDEESTLELRRSALDAALEYLVSEKALQRSEAETNLKLLIDTQEAEQSKQLRHQAAIHEEAGEWDNALDLYEEAAELREMWDRKDFAFLQKCISRVERKQAASS